MDVAPLVSAYRYRYYVLDGYPAQTKGLTRPAPTVEEALRAEAARLRAARDPEAALKALINQTNSGTLSALRAIVAQAENDLILAISRLGQDLGSPATGPHIDLRAKLDGLDRSYKATMPEPDQFDLWYDHFDAQIGHLAAISAIAREVDQTRAQPVKVPDATPGRLKWFLFALAGAAAIALVVSILTSMNAREERIAAPSAGEVEVPAADAPPPRFVRTVPIVIPVATEGANACRLELEVGAEGASLMDAPQAGRAIVRLEPRETLIMRQVLDGAGVRMVEVESTARSARGFIAEREVRLPVQQWTCDR